MIPIFYLTLTAGDPKWLAGTTYRPQCEDREPGFPHHKLRRALIWRRRTAAPGTGVTEAATSAWLGI